MPMIDIQRRHAELFRIRLGERQGNRPVKLTDSIRITAPSKAVVQAFAGTYGGEVKPWEGRWEVKIPTTELNVLVLPGQSVEQWWELYRGSVCERRCDGFQEQKSGKRCMCPEDLDERMQDRKACSPMTRLNVLCPDVRVVGAGSLVTHGLIAAQTLPQSVMVAERALAQGFMVPAVLRVEEVKGRTHFVVPRLEIVGMSFNELTGGEGVALPHATDTPVDDLELAEGGAAPLTPVPRELGTGPTGTVAEQAARVEQEPKRKRKGAAPPITPTGLAPRTAAEAAQEVVREPGAWSMTDAQRKKLMAQLSEASVDDDLRHQLVRLVTEGRTESTTELTRLDFDVLLSVAEQLAAEHLEVAYDADGSLLLNKTPAKGGGPADLAAARKHLEAQR